MVFLTRRVLDADVDVDVGVDVLDVLDGGCFFVVVTVMVLFMLL